MNERPILRLPEGHVGRRRRGTPNRAPRPRSAGPAAQAARLAGKFTRVEEALADPDAALRSDPAGVAPDRALVFVTAAPIADFARVATLVGFEVVAEVDVADEYELNDGLILENATAASPTLYATMPTLDAFRSLLTMWHAYSRNESAPAGYAPWHNLFDLLDDLRPWGPEDRLSPDVREDLEFQLSEYEHEDLRLELDIWPTRSRTTRDRRRAEAEARVNDLGGRVISTCSIDEDGFIYEALLVGLAGSAVREMIEDPSAPECLATLEGVQFVLPQFVAQSLPYLSGPVDAQTETFGGAFAPDAPVRAVLLDGTPVAAHAHLDGGVVAEDVHDLVGRSVVANRRHATSMASLILRGDLEADGEPVAGSRLLSVPVLEDSDDGAKSPVERLFVDVVHVALTRTFLGEDPLAPDAFVVNFSVGVRGAHFAGRVSSLARLLDWWSASVGVLFMVSSGNMSELMIPEMTTVAFEAKDVDTRHRLISNALRMSGHERTLLAPAEALNVLTVGAASQDLAPGGSQPTLGGFSTQADDQGTAAVSTGLGPGPLGAIKPDVLAPGGVHEVRVLPAGPDLRLHVVQETVRSGLFVASAVGGLARERARGTSCATALATRAVLNAAAELTDEGGPFEGQELPRRDLALLTRALAVNAARWPDAAGRQYEEELERVGSPRNLQAKQEVARRFGHGTLDGELMAAAPALGTTLVSVGTVRKDRAATFDLPLPASLSGDSVHRSLFVTVAWFSPVDASRARYRLAALEAVASEGGHADDWEEDRGWMLAMKGTELAVPMIKRGTVWSRRLVPERVRVPVYGDEDSVGIHVQCRDASGGGLSPDDDIRFAIAVTLELADTVRYDVHEEVRQRLTVRARGLG